MMQRQVQAETRLRSLPILVAGIACDRGYTVQNSKGLGFSIDFKTKTIFVPSLSAIGSDADALMLEGGIDHELMHERETDPAVGTDLALAHELCNVIEDPRGEVGYFRVFPGSRKNISETLQILRHRGCYGVPAIDRPFNVLTAFLLYELRAEIGQTTFSEGVRDQTRQIAMSMFGANAQWALDLAIAVVRNERGKQGTRKAMDVALAILRRFAGDNEAESRQEKRKHNDSSTFSNESTTDSPGSPESSPEITAAQQENARIAATATPDPDASFTKSVGILVSEAVVAATHNSSSGQSVEASVDVVDKRSRASSEHRRVKHLIEARNTALSLSVQLEDLLQSFGRVSHRFSYSGRFDPARAVLAACGNRRAFRRTTVSETLDTAVCVLVDRSDSMNHCVQGNEGPVPWNMARNSMYALGSTFDSLGVPFSLVLFSKTPELLHDFDDSWALTLGRRDLNAFGGTRMSKGYYAAVSSLIKRSEKRRIILMITDGRPSDWDELAVAVVEAKRWGLETRTVLIQPSRGVLGCFADMNTAPAAVSLPKDIPSAIFRALESAL